MDASHLVLVVLIVLLGVTLVWGFVQMGRLLKKDEGIDAATFLALRQLEEYVKSTRQSASRPG